MYVHESSRLDLYSYRVHVGKHSTVIDDGDSGWTLSEDKATVAPGRASMSGDLTVVVRGYTPPKRFAQINMQTHLPYVDGCSSSNLLPPLRPGDPCVQLLRIPAGCSEQRHHIHTTPRVVRVVGGRGKMYEGIGDRVTQRDLTPGATVLIDAMEPHHFTAEDEDLVVVPIHIWSSVAGEGLHPMRFGTHEI